jgi:hypothetical protein
MNWLIVTPEKKIELDAINAQFTDRCCNPEITADGTLLVGSDLIGCDYWEAYQDFLKSLDVYDKDPVWPVIPEE